MPLEAEPLEDRRRHRARADDEPRRAALDRVRPSARGRARCRRRGRAPPAAPRRPAAATPCGVKTSRPKPTRLAVEVGEVVADDARRRDRRPAPRSRLRRVGALAPPATSPAPPSRSRAPRGSSSSVSTRRTSTARLARAAARAIVSDVISRRVVVGLEPELERARRRGQRGVDELAEPPGRPRGGRGSRAIARDAPSTRRLDVAEARCRCTQPSDRRASADVDEPRRPSRDSTRLGARRERAATAPGSSASSSEASSSHAADGTTRYAAGDHARRRPMTEVDRRTRRPSSRSTTGSAGTRRRGRIGPHRARSTTRRRACRRAPSTSRRAEEVDRAVQAAKAAFPAWRALSLARRAELFFRDPRALPRAPRGPRAAAHRRARQGALRRDGRGRARARGDRVLLRHPDAAEGRLSPSRRRPAIDVYSIRQPLGVVAGHHAVQLPGDGPDVDVGAGARVRQHVRAQAVREGSVRVAAARPSCSPRRASRTASSTSSTATRSRSTRCSSTRTSPRSRSSARRRSRSTSTRRRPRTASAARRSAARRTT